MPSTLIPLKRIISPPPISLQAHPFAIPIRRKKLRASIPINHGPTSQQQKSDSSQKKSRNQHISERTDPTPNRRINHEVQERSNCNMGQNPAKVEMCGSPGEGKYIRSIASSARAGEHVMCSPCESGLSEQATLLFALPGAPRQSPSASSSASSAVPGSVRRGGQARCRRWGSPA